MEEKEKVTSEEEVKEETPVAIEDPDNPLAGQSIANIESMLKNMDTIVQIMESQWMASAKELSLNDSHMKQLAVYNDNHKTPMPSTLTEEEQQQWDHMNGIDHITMEEAIEIFGEGHPVLGVDESQTRDRIKGACNDFYHWVFSMRQYQNVHDAYIKLLEIEEEKEINKLRENALNDPNEESKAAKLKSIEQYYNWKYLDFLKDELDESTKKAIIAAFTDEKKTEYWIKRTRDKLGQLKISQKFILEIAQFEARFMDSKYHKCSNILLLYFMRICMHADCYKKDDDKRTKVVSMVTMMDFLIRNQLDDEKKERVINNIIALEDQFIDLVPEVKMETEITPPITE